MEKNRKSVLKGLYFEEDKDSLKKQVQYFLKAEKKSDLPVPLGLVVPHANYLYAGPLIAKAINLVADQNYDIVYIIGAAHKKSFNGIALADYQTYQIPLGDMEIDTEVCKNIFNSNEKEYFFNNSYFEEDHCIECVLPFVKYLFPATKIVPLLMGNSNTKYTLLLLNSVKQVMENNQKKALYIVSSNIFQPNTISEYQKINQNLEKKLKNFDIQGLSEDIAFRLIEICCGGGVLFLMHHAKLNGKGHVEILKFTNSYEITGEYNNIMGYLSAAII